LSGIWVNTVTAVIVTVLLYMWMISQCCCWCIVGLQGYNNTL